VFLRVRTGLAFLATVSLFAASLIGSGTERVTIRLAGHAARSRIPAGRHTVPAVSRGLDIEQRN